VLLRLVVLIGLRDRMEARAEERHRFALWWASWSMWSGWWKASRRVEGARVTGERLSGGLLGLDLVEHRFRGHVLLDLLDFRLAFDCTPACSAMAVTSPTSFVSSRSVSRLTCRSRSARLSAAAVMRFWLINTKVDRKIASTDATIAKTTKDGSNLGRPGATPRLAAIQAP
jgi:hypothetical protein